MMNISLNVSRHCIETASKKKYERLIRDYFKHSGTIEEKKMIEDKIDALKYFLENADFSALRVKLAEKGSDSEAILVVQENFKNIHVLFCETVTHPEWKT